MAISASCPSTPLTLYPIAYHMQLQSLLLGVVAIGRFLGPRVDHAGHLTGPMGVQGRYTISIIIDRGVWVRVGLVSRLGRDS